jgi:peptidoglycan/xylan/chitin deacetylase (PgdA/CDA1 family)
MKPVTRVAFNRSTVTFFSTRTPGLQSLCYYDVARSPDVFGHVALTFDDAPCRQGPGRSQMQMVLRLLREYGAKATFMTVGDFIQGHEEDLIEALRDGHELGNHGMADRCYHKDDPSAFSEAVELCSGRIRSLQRAAGVEEHVRWFRAPHGKYTRAMAGSLQAKGLTNVMCDTYASCPIIQDGKFIGNFLADQARHGSIILLHMPETDFREWCATALTCLLEGLARRQLRPVSVGQLSALAAAAP